MIKIRKSNERGSGGAEWLESKHTFSFSDYHDSEHMGFRSLRVINEDLIAPNSGFGLHPHKNMEIISYVVEGALTHTDNMGNESVLNAGELQAMSAGKGVVHSEFNKSLDSRVHLIQIWILPEVSGLNPSYQELRPSIDSGLNLVGSEDGRDGSLKINQNAELLFGNFLESEKRNYVVRPERGIWIQLISGSVALKGRSSSHTLNAGDGASIEDEDFEILAESQSQLLLFDLK